MPFNDIELHRIKKLVGGFCKERIPDHQRSFIKLHYEIREYDVRLIESRDASIGNHLWVDRPIAILRYDPETLRWELCWMRPDEKWVMYPGWDPTNRLQSLIEEIKGDPRGVFWG
jgi:hypothetical protein